MCTSLPPQPALSTPQHLFSFCSLILPLSSSLLTNQSPYILFPHDSLPSPTLPPSFSTPYLSGCPTQLSSALMFDAVHVVVGAVRELNRSQEIGVKPLSCTSPQIWQHGTSLMNYLRMVNPLLLSCLRNTEKTFVLSDLLWTHFVEQIMKSLLLFILFVFDLTSEQERFIKLKSKLAFKNDMFLMKCLANAVHPHLMSHVTLISCHLPSLLICIPSLNNDLLTS